MGKYQIIRNKRNKEAIFDNETSQQVSEWWNNIEADMLLNGKSQYYITINDQQQKAIFHIDNPHEPITQWWIDIYPVGLLKGKSEYYIAYKNKDECAIFHINNPNNPISQWWNQIKPYGLLQGESEYYIARNSRKEEAIFHINDPYNPVSQWWKYIYQHGYIKRNSLYYMATNNNYKSAIFHIDDPYNPITNWHYHIYPFGLIDGTSECYAVNENRYEVTEDSSSPICIYHISDPEQPLYELTKIHPKGLLYFNDQLAIYLTNQHVMLYDSINMSHNIIGVLPKNVQENLRQMYLHLHKYRLEHDTTYHLISNYLNYHFIPIVVYLEYRTYCDLYTIEQKYISRFNSIQDAEKYMQQEIAKTNKHLSCDMLRLY